MKREEILEGPISRTLLRLSWPVLVVLVVQTFVGVAETWFVSFLGTSAIAGVALVFPLFMLMTMMSNGGMGGGVSSAIARALGANRPRDAQALVTHAVLIAIAFGAMFSAGAWLGGPALFRALGAEGETLANALLYSNLIFAAAIPTWIANLLGSALRGAGNVRTPAIVTVSGAVATLALSPLLVFGWGIVPGFGVAGAAYAMIAFNTVAAVVLAMYMRSGASALRLVAARIEWRHFNDILRVGLLSAVGTVVANLTVVVTTAFVGPFGRDAIAGYGLASRLDYLLIPLLFALGTASVTMVGTNIGAGRETRARHIAWTAAAISTSAVGVIGTLAAIFPLAWIGLFSHDAEVLRVGGEYLHRVAPFYLFVGLGMALYFASQGAGRMFWPFTAGVARMLIVAVGGTLWMRGGNASLTGLFWIVAGAQVAFGAINALGLWRGATRTASRATPKGAPKSSSIQPASEPRSGTAGA